MPDGILIIDKPSDWTSMDVCAKLRGIFHEKRIGHGGTLDPMATGVLPVFIGRATRAVEFAEKSDKEYVASLRLGQVTDTQDSTGTVLEEHPVPAAPAAAVAALLPPFYRDNRPDPPHVFRHQNSRAETLPVGAQRAGSGAPRPPDYDPGTGAAGTGAHRRSPATDTLFKGTYVRTLCHDIGQALGCGAVMTNLRRTMACSFTLEQAVPLKQLSSCATPSAFLPPQNPCFSIIQKPSCLQQRRKKCVTAPQLPAVACRPATTGLTVRAALFWPCAAATEQPSPQSKVFSK